jgi:hypothetical protein
MFGEKALRRDISSQKLVSDEGLSLKMWKFSLYFTGKSLSIPSLQFPIFPIVMQSVNH